VSALKTVQEEVLLVGLLLLDADADRCELNEVRGSSSGILSVVLKRPALENSPFKG
jgi:hypothetical protein